MTDEIKGKILSVITVVSLLALVGMLIWAYTEADTAQTRRIFLSAAIAAFLGLITHLNASHRFNRSLKTQHHQLAEADRRQQDEWSRQENRASDDKEQLRKAMRQAISKELWVIITQLRDLIDELQEMGTRGFVNTSATEFMPSRPIFDALSHQLGQLPHAELIQIVEFEPEYRVGAQSLRNTLGGPRRNRGDAIMRARELIELCIQYRQPLGARVDSLTELARLNVKKPANYLPQEK
ncbi:MAG: hypothetical protein JKY60_15375 [Kordiimonadaceae bacterium]|nr:hypothetical protein [Kordiimonadaceae bacterium]